MNKLPLAAALLLAAVSAGAQTSSSDADFSVAIEKINESTAKIAAAQAKRSQAPKADPKTVSCTAKEIDDAYAAIPRCEKGLGGGFRDAGGAISKGFSRGGLSLVLLTKTDAFFYHEDCDICAAVERCSLKDGSVTNFKTAHSVDCGDLKPFLKKDVAYSACPLVP